MGGHCCTRVPPSVVAGVALLLARTKWVRKMVEGKILVPRPSEVQIFSMFSRFPTLAVYKPHRPPLAIFKPCSKVGEARGGGILRSLELRLWLCSSSDVMYGKGMVLRCRALCLQDMYAREQEASPWRGFDNLCAESSSCPKTLASTNTNSWSHDTPSSSSEQSPLC